MKTQVIRAVDVKSSYKNPIWRGIIDENDIYYQINDAELCEQIQQGGLYRLTIDEQKYKRDTKYRKKGDPKNMITKIEALPIEGEENPAPEQTGEVAKSYRGATSLPVPVSPTGGKIAVTQKQPTTVKDQIFPLIPTVGTIETTKEERDILYAPVNPEDVEIRPDGLIYLPWMEYVTRLRKAFGTKWGTVGVGMPYREGTYLYWPHYLIIRGKLSSGPAIGEQRYQPNNPMMTWGDACEGAKSNALMRLCKGLGISLELWQPKFIKEWIEKYAESYPLLDDKGKKVIKNGQPVIRWRKKK